MRLAIMSRAVIANCFSVSMSSLRKSDRRRCVTQSTPQVRPVATIGTMRNCSESAETRASPSSSSLTSPLTGNSVCSVRPTGLVSSKSTTVPTQPGALEPDTFPEYALAGLVGAVIATLLTLIPLLGWFVMLALTFVGVGAIVLATFGRRYA